MKEISVEQIHGFQIGQASDKVNATGCTVILCPKGAVGGADVRGGGPATRDTDLLDSKNTVQEVNGVVLAGGSAFGLEAATGVMKYLSEQGVGFPVGTIRVPIVVQADIFDLAVGNPVWPDTAMGYAAARDSENSRLLMGNEGAGTGASVGKMLGMEMAMKTGIGGCAYQSGELQVGAVVAVNACGDVFEADSQTVLASVYDKKAGKHLFSEELLAMDPDQLQLVSQTNTTIGCILTNATLDKAQMNKLASLSHNAYARCIRPCHLPTDGDTIFALSSEEVKADIHQVGVMAVKAMMKAIERAAKEADSAYGLESWKSLQEADK